MGSSNRLAHDKGRKGNSEAKPWPSLPAPRLFELVSYLGSDSFELTFGRRSEEDGVDHRTLEADVFQHGIEGFCAFLLGFRQGRTRVGQIDPKLHTAGN